MSISKLFAILIAAAMLFAPFAMQSGSAMAAAPSDHHSQMMEKDHCEGQSGIGKNEKSAEKPCCAAMCSAVAVPAPRFDDVRMFTLLPATPLAAIVYRGVLSEIATPPPRLA